jgi:FixJ family two-component response regulator
LCSLVNCGETDDDRRQDDELPKLASNAAISEFVGRYYEPHRFLNESLTMTNAIVYVIDDDPHMVRAVSRLLRSYEYCVQTYASPTEFLRQPLPPGPACLVLDLRMPDISGLDLQRILAQEGQSLPIVFMSGQADIVSTVRAMKEGAVDFLTKPFDDRQLLAAIQIALARSRTAQAERALLNRDREAFEKLTPRERQVCVRIARGLLNKQVGFELGTTEKTVKAQRARVIKKLAANSLADVVRLVERLRTAGIIPSTETVEATVNPSGPRLEAPPPASFGCAFDKTSRVRSARGVSIEPIANPGADVLGRNPPNQLTGELQRLRARNRGPAVI